MSTKQTTNVVPFEQVIQALLDTSKPFPPTYLHRFSDLPTREVQELRKVWPKLEDQRRVSLLEDLEDLNNHDTLVCFDDLGRIALEDQDPRARAIGINLLWECDDNHLVPTFIKMMQEDNDEVVRATAASALGMFVYLGELEEIPAPLLAQIESALLAVMNQKDSSLVQRRVLEALGFSSRDEVPPMIEKAIRTADEQWQASALFAMGRSADTRWEKYILKALPIDGEIQMEAIRAAGELELSSAREQLLELLENPEEMEEDLRDAIIWALSKIGGENVRETIEKVLDIIEDEEDMEFIQQALDNLEFTEGANALNMFDVLPKDLEGLVDDFNLDEGDDNDSLTEDDHPHKPSRN